MRPFSTSKKITTKINFIKSIIENTMMVEEKNNDDLTRALSECDRILEMAAYLEDQNKQLSEIVN